MPTTQRIQEFNKAVLDVSLDTGRAVAEAVTDGAGRAFKTLRDTGATVAGQAKAAVDRTASGAGEGAKDVATRARAVVDKTSDMATTGTKQVAGQARAQGARAAGDLGDIADDTARRATNAVDPRPGSGTAYEEWTRAELYERAQQLDVAGRSTMSKSELIEALRAS